MATILVVEDDEAISRAVVDNLEFEGYVVLAAFDGAAGLRLATTETVDLILLDVMLPEMNGYDVCRRLREAGSQTPVIMLTARGEETDKVLGLELGADDYMTKPVGVRELLARVRAVLRRVQPAAAAPTEVLHMGQARVDFSRYEATCAGEPVHLSPKAYGILRVRPCRELISCSRSGGMTRFRQPAQWTTTSPSCVPLWRQMLPHLSTS